MQPLFSIAYTVRREEAFKLFRGSPALAAWHPKVVEKYVERALVCSGPHEDDTRVKLKMPSLQVSIHVVSGM